MSSIVEQLESLVDDIVDARAALDVVEIRLGEILQPLVDGFIAPVLRQRLRLFVSELVEKRLAPDKLPVRATALARVVWRTACAAYPEIADLEGIQAAYLLHRLEAYDEALKLSELVNAHAESADSPWRRGALVMRLICLARKKRHAESYRCVQQYEAYSPSIDPDVLQIRIMTRGATAAAFEGDLDKALQWANCAVEMYKTGQRRDENPLLDWLFPPLGAAEVHMCLGEALRRKPDHLAAIDAYQRGRELAMSEQDRVGAAWCLSEVGITWERLSEFQRANELLEQAAMEAEQAGDAKAAARWRHQRFHDESGSLNMDGANGLAVIAAMFREQGASEELERLAKQIIRQEKDTGTIIEVQARGVLAGLYAEGGKHALALAAISAAIEVAERRGEQWMAMTFRTLHAQILLRMGFWQSAEEMCEKVFAATDRFMREATASEIRLAASGIASQAAEVMLTMFSQLAHNDKGPDRQPDAQRVLEIVDRSRARTFNRWLAMLGWCHETGSIELRDAARALVAADVVVEWTAHEGRSIQTAIAARETAERQLASVALSSQRTLPTFENQALPDLSSLLTTRATLLDISATEFGMVLLCFQAGFPPRTEQILWSRKERSDWQRRWRRVIDSSMAPAEAQAIQQQLYAELDANFAAPVAEWLGPDFHELIIAVHPELTALPLWSLARTSPQMTISVVPTVRSVALMSDRPSAPASRKVAMADATRTLQLAAWECDLLHGYSIASPEVDELRRLAPDMSHFHFAGHGDFDSANPYSSGIYLHGVNRSPHAIASPFARCVRLTIPGILKWIDAVHWQLAVISACSVGAPRIHAAGDFTSVPTAFLLAGARDVLAAGWRAHDAATAVLMNFFYRNLAISGCPAEALAIARQRIQCTTRAETIQILGREDLVPEQDLPFAAPMFTDAFMHYGLPQSIRGRRSKAASAHD